MLTVSRSKKVATNPYFAALAGGEVVDIRVVIANPGNYDEATVAACRLAYDAAQRQAERAAAAGEKVAEA